MIGAAIVTVSDSASAGRREDKSGDALQAMLAKIPAALEERIVVPDEEDEICEKQTKLL